MIDTIVKGKIGKKRARFHLLGGGTLKLKNIRVTANGDIRTIEGRSKNGHIRVVGYDVRAGGCGAAYRCPKKKSP